ncbi:MAG: excinuclease ABC subunit UvrA, partial [Alphaproteobacteria bacterium]|nr:excinuclease ABC subunit UvrA [Alphaproteobacteria bacterium]
MLTEIAIRGAREHNLKDIDVDIPRDKLIVITGLSGSGKSSLAFDTIYAEGQRRYVESLSAYARQFLELMAKPDVDSIEGLSPAISIEQKTTSKNPRSTVGTVTEIYDYMRLLWARVGTPYSPATGKPIESQTVSQMVDKVIGNRLSANGHETGGWEPKPGARLYILAPIVRGRKGEYRKELGDLQKQGFQRVKIDGTLYNIDETPGLDKKVKHDISVVVDRLVLRPGDETLPARLADSLETALKLADGLAIAEDADTGAQTLFSEKFACPVSGFTIPEIEPRLFSFNNPHGACPGCDGLGVRLYVDRTLVVPDISKTIRSGAIIVWDGAFKGFYLQAMEAVAAHYGFDVDTPWEDMDPAHKDIILYGSGDTVIKTTYQSKNESTWKSNKPFEGVIPNLERRLLETDSASQQEKLAQYQSSAPCETCGGKRLSEQALAVKIADKDIIEISEMSIGAAKEWFGALTDPRRPSSDAQNRREEEHPLSSQQQAIAEKILKEINERLTFLTNVGLSYLTLSRASGTLSGGESQRIRLASQIGSGLTGVLYVLDEPSIGLHQRDNNRLLETLQRLRDLGNTVIVVEH